MAKLVLELEMGENATQMASRLDSANADEAIQNLVNLFGGIQGGAYDAAVNVKIGAVQASLAGTFTDQPVAEDTVTINGVAFTAKTEGASGNEWNLVSGGTAGADAAGNASGLAAAINASSTAGIVDVIFASASAGVVTVYCKQAGKAGNAVVVAESMTNFSWAGGATKLAGGTQGTNRTFQFGKAPTTTY